jgi:RNA polymerase sigma-70 factor (ECF subfamily)
VKLIEFCPLQLVGPRVAAGGCIFWWIFCLQQNATGRAASMSDCAEMVDLAATPKDVTDHLADPDMLAVERVLGGDVQAFEGIVRRWQGPLVNMAWRYCRDRGRAEELAQEAFLRAWRGLGGWRRESSFSTWLFALAANVFRSDLKRFPTVDVPLEEVAEPAGAATQHNDVAAQFSAEAVRRAVLALPLRYREPVTLFYFHEMDVAAAAHTMGVPEGTVKARLSRARALLRRRFPHLNDEVADMRTVANKKGKEA